MALCFPTHGQYSFTVIVELQSSGRFRALAHGCPVRHEIPRGIAKNMERRDYKKVAKVHMNNYKTLEFRFVKVS